MITASVLEEVNVGFTAERANHFAHVSQLAYTWPDEPAVHALGYSSVDLFMGGPVFGLVLTNEHSITIAFRGTRPDQLADWFEDSQVCLTAGPGGRVHRGFLEALRNVFPTLQGLDSKYRGGGRAIWLTGHSLGAALATLLAAYLEGERNRPISGLYTYGSPRVGNASFASRFDAGTSGRVWRVVCEGDIVARVPWRALGYAHVGTPYLLTRDGRLTSGDAAWIRTLDTASPTLGDLRNPECVRDHFMSESYLRYLDRAVAAVSE